MSLVRVAVPVLHGRCKFFFEKGRPWSVIEHVLLESLAKKRYTMSELAIAGKLPYRLAIEAVVRLMRAGWVEMVERGSSVHFRATSGGAVAATYEELPNAPRQLSRNINFVVDQVTGTVYRRRELPFFPQHLVEEMAKKEKIVWVDRPEVVRRDEVGPLLEALFNDDERFIAMDFDGGRLAERWSLVRVRDGSVQELTSRAPARLAECVEAAASGVSVEERRDGSTLYRMPAEYRLSGVPSLPVRRVNIVPKDLVLGGEEHRDVLYGALSRSRERVVIHSTFIAWDRFEELWPAMLEAVGRGVRIDVLWGQDDSKDGGSSTREVVRRIAEKVATEQVESLYVHPFSTGSHSKVLLCDGGEPGRMIAFVGSCNWLSSSFFSFEATIRLRDPIVVADVVDQMAELSKGGRGNWSSLTQDLASISAALRKKGGLTSRGRNSAQVVVGSMHAEMVRRARDESRSRILVLSHRWGTAASPIVLAPALTAARTNGVHVEVYYGTVTGPVESGAPEEGAEGIESLDVVAIRRPRVHAKVLAWDDDSVVITSQNWLSADPPDSFPRQELGVSVCGPGLATMLRERFQDALGAGSGASATATGDHYG